MIYHNLRTHLHFGVYIVTTPELIRTETVPQGLHNNIIADNARNFNPTLLDRIMQLFRKR